MSDPNKYRYSPECVDLTQDETDYSYKCVHQKPFEWLTYSPNTQCRINKSDYNGNQSTSYSEVSSMEDDKTILHSCLKAINPNSIICQISNPNLKPVINSCTADKLYTYLDTHTNDEPEHIKKEFLDISFDQDDSISMLTVSCQNLENTRKNSSYQTSFVIKKESLIASEDDIDKGDMETDNLSHKISLPLCEVPITSRDCTNSTFDVKMSYEVLLKERKRPQKNLSLKNKPLNIKNIQENIPKDSDYRKKLKSIKTKEATSTTNKATLKSKQTTSARKQATLIEKQATSKKKQPASTRQITLKTKQVTSKTKEDTPKIKQVTSKTKQVTSKTKQDTSKTKENTPKIKQVTSKTKQATSKTKQATSKTKQATSKTKQATSKTKQVTSKTKQATSKTKQATSKTKQVTSKTKQATSKTKQATLMTNKQTQKLSKETQQVELRRSPRLAALKLKKM